MNDTIVACSTPQGRGGIAVVRMSGKKAGEILATVKEGRERDPRKTPRRMCHAWIVDQEGKRLDEVLVIFFPAPNTYTGEEMIEVHCHGGEAVVETLIAELVKAGARPASRGEFTRRSFEAGKMDLTRAEGVLRLIEASTREEVRGAARALSGEFGKLIRDMKDEMTNLIAQAEAAIDFPEETMVEEMETRGIESTIEKVNTLIGMIRRGYVPGDEVVLAGKPNVGKSSIMNAMLRRNVSIVTREPGTTRDAISADLLLGGMKITMVDTAGIVDKEFSSEAERESDRVAREKIEKASLLVWVTDSPNEDPEEHVEKAIQIKCPLIWVVNKSDLIPQAEIEAVKNWLKVKQAILLSALSGQGVDDLEKEVVDKLIEEYGPADGIPVTVRQEDALRRMMRQMKEAASRLRTRQLELAAEDIRHAIKEAGGILGEEVETEEILDKIFEEFCVGK